MKTLMMMIALSFFFLLTHAQSSEVEIAPFQKARIDCPAGPPQEVSIQNLSGKGIGVAVVDAATGQQVRGFGLGPRAQAEVYITEGQVLELINSTARKRLAKVRFAPQPPAPVANGQRSINFTLHNSSLRSIPLIIPGVMNPNLSPLSDSGVSLKVGQPIYFRHQGKEALLLKVDEGISDSRRIDVPELIKKRKKELEGVIQK
jgi:hypothetical protein